MASLLSFSSLEHSFILHRCFWCISMCSLDWDCDETSFSCSFFPTLARPYVRHWTSFRYDREQTWIWSLHHYLVRHSSMIALLQSKKASRRRFFWGVYVWNRQRWVPARNSNYVNALSQIEFLLSNMHYWKMGTLLFPPNMIWCLSFERRSISFSQLMWMNALNFSLDEIFIQSSATADYQIPSSETERWPTFKKHLAVHRLNPQNATTKDAHELSPLLCVKEQETIQRATNFWNVVRKMHSNKSRTSGQTSYTDCSERTTTAAQCANAFRTKFYEPCDFILSSICNFPFQNELGQFLNMWVLLFRTFQFEYASHVSVHLNTADCSCFSVRSHQIEAHRETERGDSFSFVSTCMLTMTFAKWA